MRALLCFQLNNNFHISCIKQILNKFDDIKSVALKFTYKFF